MQTESSKSLIKDRQERLDYAETWMRELLRVTDSPGLIETIEVDMAQCKDLIAKHPEKGIKVTYTHLIVRATAIVLSRHSEFNQLIIGRRRLYPKSVDIGLSVSGTTVVAPVLVIKDAGNKTLKEIASEIIKRTPETRENQLKLLSFLRRWGWIIPFGPLRRSYLRFMSNQFKVRRMGVGTFQVSCLSNVERNVPLLFGTAAVLGVGEVRERVVVYEGQVKARPTVFLSFCADHKVWDGVRGAKFLNTLNEILNNGELEKEV